MESQSQSEPTKVIFFDLDRTLFDHDHSLDHGIAAVQDKYSSLAELSRKHLKNKYDYALYHSYNRFLNNTITDEEADIEKVRSFYTLISLPQPSLEEIKEFRATYRAAYRKMRKATEGSIETLTQLRAHGYKIGIITNGGIQNQTDKVKAIGLEHLIDHIIISEEVGHKKPERQIFQSAIDFFGAPLHTTVMVGDDVKRDIQGALDAQLVPVLYMPNGLSDGLSSLGAPVIRQMTELLDLMGIEDKACENE
ncbi:hypothetical protein ACHAPJ_011187 [Fusarium lateritium]